MLIIHSIITILSKDPVSIVAISSPQSKNPEEHSSLPSQGGKNKKGA